MIDSRLILVFKFISQRNTHPSQYNRSEGVLVRLSAYYTPLIEMGISLAVKNQIQHIAKGG